MQIVHAYGRVAEPLGNKGVLGTKKNPSKGSGDAKPSALADFMIGNVSSFLQANPQGDNVRQNYFAGDLAVERENAVSIDVAQVVEVVEVVVNEVGAKRHLVCAANEV